jgi:mevalonate kinase
MQHPLLIKENQTIYPIDIPRYELKSDDAIFLINSGRAIKTAPLVDQFMKDCENQTFKERILNEYIPVNNSCIQSLIDADINKFTHNVQTLSEFQLNYFTKMIPPSLHEEWKEGLSSGKFALKLCGSGGGGFILGFTRNYSEVKRLFAEKEMEIIPVYQYESK